MNIKEFIIDFGLKQADAIILKKKLLGMVDHYAIFMGYKNNIPVFVANYKDGVKEVPTHELNEILQTYEPYQIEPFRGSEYDRHHAIQRALSRIGEKAYNYVANNCEHFKNWVHHGTNKSEQVDKAGNILIGTGITIGIGAALTKRPSLGLIAVGLVLLGIIFKDKSEE